MSKGQLPQSRIVPALLLGSAAYWAYGQSGPAYVAGEFSLIPTIAAGVVAISALVGLGDIAQGLAGAVETQGGKRVKGHHGTEGWIKHRWQIWREHKWFGWHPYWGTLNGKALFLAYESVAVSIGPPASKKTTAILQPMALSLRESKLIPDFKGTLSATLTKPLEKRGEHVFTIDLGNIFAGSDNETAYYNLLCTISDLLFETGGLLVISDEVTEITLEFLPEKDNSNQDGEYFRITSRDYLELVIHMNVCILGRDAQAAHCLEMLSNQRMLLQHALWFSGRLPVEDDAGNKTLAEFPMEDAPWAKHHSDEDALNYKKFLNGLAGAVADHLLDPDPKASGTFITGARQGVRRFNVTTHVSKISSKTTIRFSSMKERITTVFITMDPTREKAQKDALSLLNNCALRELKRSPNKHVPVTVLADEATNYYLAALGNDGFLSWARGYGIKVHVIFQFISEYRRVYGDAAFKTLLNAAEIIQLLPGQSEPEILGLIEDMLGTESVIAENSNSNGFFSGVNSKTYSEIGKPLMTKAQIRQCKQVVTFVRQLKPMLTDLPQVFAISPFRKQIDPDPHHGGKRYLQRVKLRLEGRGGPLIWRLLNWAFFRKHKQGAAK